MKTKKIQRMIQNALLLALLILFTLIKFPLGAISFTMQLFIVFLIVQLTPFLDALSILFTYLLMGLIGIPVFSMGGGLSYIYQPSLSLCKTNGFNLAQNENECLFPCFYWKFCRITCGLSLWIYLCLLHF